MSEPVERLVALCAPGLEAITAGELAGQGLREAPGPRASGAVAFSGGLRELYRANLHLRSASRVLVGLGELRATKLPELRRKASRFPWERHLVPGRPIALQVRCERSRLYHERAVAERVAGAIADRLGTPSPVRKSSEGADAQLIVVRVEEDRCALGVDSSGAPLYRRGYRLAVAKAPLQETLAAALVLASGWDGMAPLLDPFCGSGTIAIEAALLAGRLPPGRARRFAFMDWPGFDGGLWNGVWSEPGGPAAAAPRILASDRDAGAIEAARANAARAGVADCIEFSCRPVSAIEPPPGPGWVVSNPPYGVRLRGAGDLRDLYARLGAVLRAKCPGWRVSLLCGSAQLPRATGLGFAPGLSTLNGGLPVRLASCKVP